MKWNIIFSCLIVLTILLILHSCEEAESPGEKLAKKNCSSCHKYPEPAELNKATWINHVLPQMGGFMGFRLFEGGTYFEDDRIQRSLSLEDWNAIMRFYVTNSPEEIPSAERTHPVLSENPFFQAESFPYRKSESATTFISVDNNHRLFFGDGVSSRLYQADSALHTIKDSMYAGTGLSDVISDSSGFFLLSMGVLTPSDALKGKLLHAMNLP